MNANTHRQEGLELALTIWTVNVFEYGYYSILCLIKAFQGEKWFLVLSVALLFYWNICRLTLSFAIHIYLYIYFHAIVIKTTMMIKNDLSHRVQLCFRNNNEKIIYKQGKMIFTLSISYVTQLNVGDFALLLHFMYYYRAAIILIIGNLLTLLFRTQSRHCKS